MSATTTERAAFALGVAEGRRRCAAEIAAATRGIAAHWRAHGGPLSGIVAATVEEIGKALDAHAAADRVPPTEPTAALPDLEQAVQDADVNATAAQRLAEAAASELETARENLREWRRAQREEAARAARDNDVEEARRH